MNKDRLNSQVSAYDDDEQYRTVGTPLSPDERVAITLKAKANAAKALRKNGEMLYGPSVAMAAQSQTISHPDSIGNSLSKPQSPGPSVKMFPVARSTTESNSNNTGKNIGNIRQTQADTLSMAGGKSAPTKIARILATVGRTFSRKTNRQTLLNENGHLVETNINSNQASEMDKQGSVFEDLEPLPSINETFTPKTAEELQFLKTSLSKVVIFSQYSAAILEKLAETMTLKSFPANFEVCKQDEFQSEFYIVKEGTLKVLDETAHAKHSDQTATKKQSAIRNVSEMTSNTKSSHMLIKGRSEFVNIVDDDSDNSPSEKLVTGVVFQKGDGFGELAMNFGSARARTVKSVVPCDLYVLERNHYRKIVQLEAYKTESLLFEALKKIKILDRLKDEQISAILPFVTFVNLPKGTKIVEKGSIAGTFYMIVKGKVDCLVTEMQDIDSGFHEPSNSLSAGHVRNDITGDNEYDDDLRPEEKTFEAPKMKLVEKVYTLHDGDYFGERGWLQMDKHRKADVVARTDVELMAIAYESFTDSLENLTDAFEENIRLKAVENAPFFDNLNKEESEQLEKSLMINKFGKGEYIIQEGKPNHMFYILRNGQVDISRKLDHTDDNDVEIATLSNQGYFGEGSLLYDRLPNATIVARTDVSCYALSREDFHKFIRDEKLELLRNRFQQRNRAALIRTRDKKNQILSTITMKDVRSLNTLGSGCFGLVKLAEVGKIKGMFALKILEKGTVIRNNQEVNVVNEKNVLMECDHPFIVRLYRTFKDKLYLYFLMEFIQGGEMFQFLHHVRNGYLDNETARFYIACVVDALDYLHRKRIVYRDLKPENLMIDEEGYGKVVDFGFAKRLVYRTFTLCGTAQYLAPEILANKGYGKSVDFWCLGILIFELFTGTTPFKNRNRNEMFNAIRYETRIRFNKRWKGADKAKELVCLLLHKVPKKRLGCDGSTARGFKDVKDHTWFTEAIDFQKLYFKELTPPWKPTIQGAKDTGNFEEYDESDNPLRGKYDDRAGDEAVWKDF